MRRSTIFETLAARFLARQGIGVIWQLHLRASASHLSGNWLAAAALIGIADAAERQWAHRVLRKGGKLVMVGLYGGANPISTVLFPFKMMTIEGSYVGTLDDLRELLALVQAGRVPPIPIETRPADQASAALSDLKSGGKVQGRVVLHHQ